ncbi:MAG: discoidin domain-containing protein, partial [Bacteroidetes bacterium]|nr:discoidin domain-containing protein [Bacteroidota bacterium]
MTDGNYTSDQKFWISKTTVGWQYPKKLTIEIDLAKSSPISTVAFNTVRGGSGVEFPQDIFVFTSTDQVNYAYIGDAAKDPDNVHGDYDVKKFMLANIDRTARYVKFVVIPKGAFVFC